MKYLRIVLHATLRPIVVFSWEGIKSHKHLQDIVSLKGAIVWLAVWCALALKKKLENGLKRSWNYEIALSSPKEFGEGKKKRNTDMPN
jgi:hypothetical protein